MILCNMSALCRFHRLPSLSTPKILLLPRLWSLILLAIAVVMVPLLCIADTIYLKNGRQIDANVIREDAKQVFYERGGAEVALPRSIVDRVEKSSSPASPGADGGANRANSVRDLPLPPAPPPDSSSDAGSAAVKGNAVDEAFLQGLDNEVLRNPSAENRRLLAQGYQQAAIFLTRHGDPEAAIEKYRHASKFAPDDYALMLARGYLLVTQKHQGEAIDLLRPAAERYPKSADIPLLLGTAYYATEKLDQAIEEWKKALAIEDNPRLRDALAKAEQEQSVASSYLELRSEHFLLRFEKREAKPLSEEVLKTLEAAFQDLQRQLEVYPHETIVVLLYPDMAFRDITSLPEWVGAVNDGKIRIPISGVSTMTLELARILKHELTHSFVRQVALDRCPMWFNEGLAQLEEGATTARLGSQLARAFVLGLIPPYSALEGTFMNLPADDAGLAYAKSLAALEYLRDTHGLAEVRRLLKLMSANPDINALLQDELRLSYPAFEREVATYVEKRYGSP
jgi:tetratricopeptide (TPR) repeat protein